MSALSTAREAAQLASSLRPLAVGVFGSAVYMLRRSSGSEAQFHGLEVEVEFADGGVTEPFALGSPRASGGYSWDG